MSRRQRASSTLSAPLVLTPQAAWLFRITHIDNVPWLLRHGLRCRTSPVTDPGYVPIGDQEIICKRNARTVPVPPHGMLSDYVPFYFTPWSPMLYNIVTGYRGISRQSRTDIVIIASSLARVAKLGLPFVITDGHALMHTSSFFRDASDLDRIDWDLLNRKDFRRDPEDPGKLDRYQAEALVLSYVPVTAILGIACYDRDTDQRLEAMLADADQRVPVRTRPDWYL